MGRGIYMPQRCIMSPSDRVSFKDLVGFYALFYPKIIFIKLVELRNCHLILQPLYNTLFCPD